MRMKASGEDRILRIEPEAVPGILKTGRPKGLFYASGKSGWIGVDSRGKKAFAFYHASFPHVLAWLRQVPAPVNPTPEERKAAKLRKEIAQERERAERMHWKTLVVQTIRERPGENPDEVEMVRRMIWSREAEELLIRWVRDGDGEELIAARFGITAGAVANKKNAMGYRLYRDGKSEDDV